MRRSAALLSLFFLLAAGAPPASAAVRAPCAPLVIGIFNDPATIAGLAVLGLRGIAWLMEMADAVAAHVREDVRLRQGRPQHTVPRLLPVRTPQPLPLFPVLPPVRSGPRPIVDTVPVRPAS